MKIELPRSCPLESSPHHDGSSVASLTCVGMKAVQPLKLIAKATAIIRFMVFVRFLLNHVKETLLEAQGALLFWISVNENLHNPPLVFAINNLCIGVVS